MRSPTALQSKPDTVVDVVKFMLIIAESYYILHPILVQGWGAILLHINLVEIAI